MYCMRIYWYLLVGNCSSSNHSSSPLFPWHQKFNITIQEAMVGGASILIWGEILYCRTKMPRHISLIIVVRKTDCFLITASHKSFRYFINGEWFLAKTGSLSLYERLEQQFWLDKLILYPKWNPKTSWQSFCQILKINWEGQL